MTSSRRCPSRKDELVAYNYEVRWDNFSHIFTFFHEAREFLLNELWWLAEDLDSEKTFAAWSEVLSWEYDMLLPLSVEAGEPPALYSIVRVNE